MSAMTAHVLVVEDEPQIRRFVCAALGREGCACSESANAFDGLRLLASDDVDLVLLDLGLPDMSGIDFIRELRTWSKVPVLILSARNSEDDKIAALDAGADDYLSKPFGIGELLARVRALLRRQGQGSDALPCFEFGDIQVDLSRRIVSRDGVEIHLTKIEYRLLAVMLASSGKVLTHRHLMQEVWGAGYAEQGHYLRIYVGRLRQKLELDATQPKYFLTETGIGYRFQS